MELDYKLLGERIKQKRAAAKMSQEKLSELAGLSIPHMSHVETGNTKVSLPALVNIANALKVSVDELLCDSIYKSKAVFDDEIASAVKDCNNSDVRIIADMVKALKISLTKVDRFQ